MLGASIAAIDDQRPRLGSEGLYELHGLPEDVFELDTPTAPSQEFWGPVETEMLCDLLIHFGSFLFGYVCPN